MVVDDCFRRRFSSYHLIPRSNVRLQIVLPVKLYTQESAGFGDDLDDLDIKLKGISISIELSFNKFVFFSNFIVQ